MIAHAQAEREHGQPSSNIAVDSRHLDFTYFIGVGGQLKSKHGAVGGKTILSQADCNISSSIVIKNTIIVIFCSKIPKFMNFPPTQ